MPLGSGAGSQLMAVHTFFEGAIGPTEFFVINVLHHDQGLATTATVSQIFLYGSAAKLGVRIFCSLPPSPLAESHG